MVSRTDRWWRLATIVLVAIWIFAVTRLMIADVWDETNALVAFGSESWTTAEALRFVLTQSMGIWRPIPSALAVLVIRGAGDSDVAWRVMRGLNIAMLLASLPLLVNAMNRWTVPAPRKTALFTLAFLYSAGSVITAGWFANLFDASVLLLVSSGIVLITRGRHVTAGVLFGLAFFCKETAALVLPLLVMFVAAGRLRVAEALRAGAPAAALGAIYFTLRSRVIPLGSAADTHQFAPADFLPTLLGLADSYWRQTMWGAGPGVIGVGLFVLSVGVMPRWRLRAAYLLFILATAVIYWQMFSIYQDGVLMHYLIFVGRLFLIPVVMTLYVLAVERREWALAIFAVPLLLGATATYARYERFQRAYGSVYAQAERVPGPLRIHYPMKPLNDPRRGIEIGDFPDAPLRLDPRSGRLQSNPTIP